MEHSRLRLLFLLCGGSHLLQWRLRLPFQAEVVLQSLVRFEEC